MLTLVIGGDNESMWQRTGTEGRGKDGRCEKP